MERIFEKDQYISGSVRDFTVYDKKFHVRDERYYKNAKIICPQCKNELNSKMSYRIENKYVAFFREYYYKCQCSGYIWIYTKKNDNNQYVNSESIFHKMDAGHYNSNPLIRVPSDTIQFIYEQLDCHHIRTRTNFHRFYQMLITLSNNIQGWLLISPDKIQHDTDNDFAHTGLHTNMDILARWSSRTYWRRYKELLIGDTIRIICNLVDTESHHKDFNLRTLNKGKRIEPINNLIRNFENNQGEEEGRYHIIRANRNKDFMHTDSNFEWIPFPFSLLKECYIDIVNATNTLNAHIGHDFNIRHIELYTLSDSLSTILPLFEKLDYSFIQKPYQ